MRKRFFSAVMAAMMLSLASFGAVTASAEETSDSVVEAAEQVTEAENDSSETEETTEGTTASDSEINTVSSALSEEELNMEDFMRVMAQLAESGNVTVTADESSPDYYGDPYYDTDGNATLIKSEQIIYNTEEMQFIAVTTKDGHVFYVLINYTAENGQDNVYFLNKVDDYDLYALLYAGEEDEDGNAKFTPEEAAKAAESANGRVQNEENSTDTTEISETNAEGDEAEDSGETTVKNVSVNMSSLYLVVGAAALIGVGACFFLLKKKKDSGSRKAEFDPDEYNSEDDELDMFDGNDSYDDE